MFLVKLLWGSSLELVLIQAVHSALGFVPKSHARGASPGRKVWRRPGDFRTHRVENIPDTPCTEYVVIFTYTLGWF